MRSLTDLMIRLSHLHLVVEAAAHRVRPVLPEQGDLELLDHVVVEEAEEEGDRHALAGGGHRGDHLVHVLYRGAGLRSHRHQQKM